MKKVLFVFLLGFASVAAAAGQPVIVLAEKLNIRAQPSTESPIVSQVSKGDRLVVKPISGGWARIARGAETGGFVSRRYLKLSSQKDGALILQPDGQRDASGQNPNQEGYSALTLLLVLVAAIFLAKALFFRSAKKEFGNRKKESEKKPNQTQHGSAAVKARIAEGKRDLHDASLTKGLDLGQPSKSTDDFPLVKVQHVIDGDTVIVACTRKKMKIRLDSIDCPEDGQPWGDVATAGLIKMIGGRRVKIEEHGEDHYGRLLATIYVENMHDSEWVNVNEKMVAKGHAWVMRRYYGHLSRRRKDKLNRLVKMGENKADWIVENTKSRPALAMETGVVRPFGLTEAFFI